jgi:hypothetical protein
VALAAIAADVWTTRHTLDDRRDDRLRGDRATSILILFGWSSVNGIKRCKTCSPRSRASIACRKPSGNRNATVSPAPGTTGRSACLPMLRIGRGTSTLSGIARSGGCPVQRCAEPRGQTAPITRRRWALTSYPAGPQDPCPSARGRPLRLPDRAAVRSVARAPGSNREDVDGAAEPHPVLTNVDSSGRAE